MQGWIKLHRSIMEHYLYTAEPFDRLHAWIDILLNCNHESKKIMLNGELIEVGAGEYITSLRKLCERWGWSRTKIKRFFNELENDDMITVKSDSKKTLIRVLNYCVYQDNPTAKKATEKPQKDHKKTTGNPQSDRTNATEKPQKNPNKNVKNDKNEENIYNSQQRFYSDNKSSYVEIAKLYNEICVDLPKCKLLNKERTNQMKKCIDIMEKTGTDFEMFFRKVQASDFLTGRNRSNSDKWQADFDWIFKPVNCTKIIEGNYDNKLDNYLRY